MNSFVIGVQSERVRTYECLGNPLYIGQCKLSLDVFLSKRFTMSLPEQGGLS